MTPASGLDCNSPSTRTAEEYDVENAEYIAELLVSDVLTTSVGKQSMKVKILPILILTRLLNK